MSRLTRDGTAETVSRDQILRHERGEENIHFLCSADHEQDWQPYPVDPCVCVTFAICVTMHNTTILLDLYCIVVTFSRLGINRYGCQ